MEVANPIVKKIQDNIESLKLFEQEILKLDDDKMKEIILNYPVVYIHTWKNDKGQYEVYVGESNNIIQRTKQHYNKMQDKKEWQHSLLNGKEKYLYIIGHEHFNKSMTMDIESKLIHYLTSVEKIEEVHNEKDNPQNYYYTDKEKEAIFTKIWKKLRKDNKELFPLESYIKDSAIFKASPLHELTEEQQEAKEKILDKIDDALKSNKRGQLIFIEGEAGTGKTVLNSSTFYELFCRKEERKEEKLNCFLLVNHKEQLKVYEQIFNKLGISDKYGQVVYNPTTFINKYSKDNHVDVVFVDEAHLLWTQGNRGYHGENQLCDINNIAKVVIVMFDENQILTTGQYWKYKLLQKCRNKAKANDNYIKLENQLRIHANEEVIDWINSFTKDSIIKNMPKDFGGYDIKICDSPKELEKEIKNKASKEDSRLSRIIATYDWPYVQENHKGCLDKYWEVKINVDEKNKWHKPWNRELEKELDKKERKNIKNLAWAEQPQTINEIGSTYTIQGFDLNYAGVILGPSVKYKDGHIVFDSKESKNKGATQNRKLTNKTSKNFAEELLKHEVRVLMTRGVNGLYIYACDDELREHLKQCSYKGIQYNTK